MADPTVIIPPLRRLEPGVQFRQAIHLGHRHQMGAAEPATLALNPALLVGAVDAGLAVERVEPMVRTEGDPTLLLQPVPADQHPRHRRLQVVIANLVERDTAQHVKRVLVALQERLLSLGGEGAVHPLPDADSRSVNRNTFVRTPRRSIHKSAKSTSPSAPGRWVCDTNACSTDRPA
jgi:hypothetical protein